MTAAASFTVERPDKPYPGLRPFEAHEWSIFFGRERMIDDVIDRLSQNRLVLIHGASGSGKSSLVRAGIMPKLARQHRRHGAAWLTCAMRPAGGPLWNLAVEIARLEGAADDTERVGAIVTSFSRREISLAQIVGARPALTGKSLCILVDQFEELFRFEKETSREEAEVFVDLIARATREVAPAEDAAGEGPVGDVHVVVTMRSEFLGQCARFSGLAEVINKTQYLVPRMDDDALVRAVRRPAQLFKGIVPEDLAWRLISRVRGREDELPLLQHGLMLMWEEAAGRPAGDGRIVLNGTMVEKAGGLAELLSDHADNVMRAVAPDAQRERIVETVFRALTDVNAEGAAIRRPQRCGDLAALARTSVETLRPMLDAFRAPGVSFLTPYAPAPLTENAIIDISHEALIRCWRRIGAGQEGWLKQEFDDGLAWRSLLSEAEAFATDPERVLSPAATKDRGDLVTSRNALWADRYGGGWPLVDKLLDASRRAAARSRRRSRLAMASLALLTIGAVSLAYVSFREWKVSEQQATNLIHRGRIVRLIIEDKLGIKNSSLDEVIDQKAEAGDRKLSKDKVDVKSVLFFEIRSMSADKDPSATYLLGLMYYNGYGTVQDYAAATRYLMAAADAGYRPALSAIATLYTNGQGVAQDYAKAREWYRKAADAGDAPAMLYLGVMYENGQGGPKDLAKAREWYLKSAEASNATAMRYLGDFYDNGQGVPKNSAIALDWYEKAADAGDAIAMRYVGVFYENGLGTAKDISKAREWYEKAGNAGDAVALRYVGDFYSSGLGVPKDPAKAREWYDKAANAGDAPAMRSIGLQYESGDGVPQDYGKAREWYDKAVAAKDAAALRFIGFMYESGEGVPRDYGKARDWYEKAAAAKDITALRFIGVLYENGEGMPRDDVKAREWYEKAAAANDATAMRYIGVLYENAKGMPQDFAKAREWYEKAAAAKDPTAMRYIGDLYRNGQGVPPDMAKARDWYEKAAAAGDAIAMRYIGSMYESGMGTPKNMAKARDWYEKAAAANDTTAIRFLGDLYRDGQGVKQDYVKARDYYEKAAAGGDTAAMRAAGLLYEGGNGVPKNYAKAREWYDKAVAAKDAVAMRFIGVLYENGQGVPRDDTIARDWYEKAAAAKDTIALRYIGELYKNGKGVKQDYAKARDYFEKAAAAGDNVSMEDIGRLYDDGSGVPMDHAQARDWYEKALAAGDDQATISLGWISLILGDYQRALSASEQGVRVLPPNDLVPETNRAHALMFLGRSDEARAIYMAHIDVKVPQQNNETWQQVILNDFAELRKAGRSNPLMDEIEQAFAEKR